MTQKPLDQYPQRLETWLCVSRRIRAWITPPDEDPYRPCLTLIFNLDKGLVQAFEMFAATPSPEEILEVIFEAIRTRAPGSNQRPHRPKQIHFENESLIEPLRLALDEIDVSISHHPHDDIADEIIADLETHMYEGKPDAPGLLSGEGVTPELVADLFSAAADFYRAAPWVSLTNMQPLAIKMEGDSEAQTVVVMGNGGMEYGLLRHLRWEHFMSQFEPVDDPMERIPPSGAHSLTFDSNIFVPFDDLDAIEEYGWEIADELAYPLPFIFTQDQVLRPGRDDLLFYEAAMRAIPKFTAECLKADDQGDYDPAKKRSWFPAMWARKKWRSSTPPAIFQMKHARWGKWGGRLSKKQTISTCLRTSTDEHWKATYRYLVNRSREQKSAKRKS